MGDFLILLNCLPVVFVYHDDKEDGGKFDDDGGDVIDVFLATEINDNGDVNVDSKVGLTYSNKLKSSHVQTVEEAGL